MLGEFDFASPADEAAALALILTAVERKTIDMAPGFMINASTQGSGKTTLARMVHLLITGHDMPVAAMSEDVTEQDKALTAMLLASTPIVCFDNVPDAFTVKSPVLARVLTSPTHTGRILGLSKMAELPTNTVFVVTGNNITADIDLSRRLLEVCLASTQARPEQRRFKNPDVVTYVLRNRVRWMQAVLAILEGDRGAQSDAPASGFHQWDKAVRWPLVNAGVGDPVIKFDEVREKSPDHDRQVAWMLGLVHGFGVGNKFRAGDLTKGKFAGQPVPTLNDASDEPRKYVEMFTDYLDEHPPAKGWDNQRSIGWTLNGLLGRIIEGYKLSKKTMRGSAYYVIEQVNPSGGG
jgi:putative DNA primase/helicase